MPRQSANFEIVWVPFDDLRQIILLETGLVAILEMFGFDCLLGLVAGLETAWVHPTVMTGLQIAWRQMAGLQTAWRLMTGLQIACVQRLVADLETVLENLLIFLKAFEALHLQREFSLVVRL